MPHASAWRCLAGPTAVLLGQLAAVSASHGLTLREADLAVTPADGSGPVVRRAVEILAREVAERTGSAIVTTDPSAARLHITVGLRDDPALAEPSSAYRQESRSLGADGFLLTTIGSGDGRGYLIGESPSGVVAGVGRLLALADYAEGALRLPSVTVVDSPKLPVRGIYFATHFYNFYHVAPLEEIDRVIEDFALWGGNQLMVWFDMHHFEGIDDPAAQEHLARLRHLGATARSVGVQFGIAFLANEAYNSSPEELRADPRTGTAHYERELCVSKPGALELVGKWQAEVMDAFGELDLMWTWPYDQGGCACEQCAPWGANGYLRASEQLAGLFAERYPGRPVYLSTWLLDQVNARGEYEGLFEYIRSERPQWFTGIIAGTHGDYIPKQLMERPDPERYPLTCFPEISMVAMNPWGEHGANPLPGFCSRLMDTLSGNVIGGWPYSEGIYEDLNKYLFARFYWDPEVPVDDSLRSYASLYLGPHVVGDAVRLFHLMESTHARNGWKAADLKNGHEEWELARSIDERLAPWAKSSWRWRILFVRAAIDGILAEADAWTPQVREALVPLCEELTRIYHADRTFIGPPPLPPAPDPDNLALGCAVAVSSAAAGYEDRVPHLVDGIRSEHDGENFWCHDRNAEETAHVTVDLGRVVPVREVRLQFRGLHGVYWFVPHTVGFETSADGEAFTPVAGPAPVPTEGAPYAPEPWVYPIGREARHIRVVLGPSQHHGDEHEGTLELNEVEVFGE